jgi:hypothetical protein
VGTGAFLAFNPALFNDGDTGWHLATGQLILDTKAVPHHDPFSFTFRGQAWTAHEWLAEVLMAGVFAARGWSGLALLFAAAIGGLLLLVGNALSRALPPRYVLVALVGLVVVLAPALLARPHVLAWPLLAGWLMILLRARELGQAPPLAAALLMLVWANLHASFVIGLGLAGVFALEALVESRDLRRTTLQWGPFGALALVASLATPHGIQGLLFPFQVSGMRMLPLIAEWRPTRLPDDLGFVLFAAALIGGALLRWRQVGAVRLVLLAGLTWMAITHSRHHALFAIVGLLAVVPRAVGEGQHETGPSRRTWLVLAAAALLLAIVRDRIPLHRPDTATYPGTALAQLPADFRRAAVFNSYSFGGPLVQVGIAPFIDGRSDMYGDDFTIAHARMIDGDIGAFRSAQRRWNLRWTLLQTGTPLIAKLDREPGWRRLYVDRWAVIHVRTS